MAQTEASTETALRDALADASEQAATRPLTDAAGTEYGRILQQGDDGAIFDRYLETLVYLNAKEQLGVTGQRVGGVETEVRLSGISDPDEFGAALDRVTVRAGTDHPDIEPGVVEARLENVSIIALRDGEEIDRRKRTITVAVATPLYQLHNRTTRFQDRLDAGVTESGFSQRFNARTYALGWARGYAQYGGAPVTEVIANRHLVPAANDAVYRTQKDIFGAADPQLNNAIRRGWFCMAVRDAKGLYSGFTGEEPAVAERVCNESGWLFGDQATGELPEVPGTGDLLGEAPGMDAPHKIGVNQTAALPLRKMVAEPGEHSVDSIIDRIFEIEVSVVHSLDTVEEPTFTHDPPDAYEQGRSRVERTVNEQTTVEIRDVSEPADAEQFYELSGTVRLELKQTKSHAYRDKDGRHETTTTATGTRVVEFEMIFEESQISPNANIDGYNRDNGGELDITDGHTYQPGPDREDASKKRSVPDGARPAGFENYLNVGNAVLTAFFTDRNATGEDERDRPTTDRIESELADSWEEATTRDDIDAPSKRTVSLEPPARFPLERTVMEDLAVIQRNASEITHSFERRELLHDGNGTGPFGELAQKVEGEKRTYLQREQPYANVGQKVVYEARYSYFEVLEAELDRFDAAHGHAMDELDAELSDIGLDRALTYLQQGVTATPPEPVPLESSSLTDDVTYEISGSPTYLVTENITTEEVPPVRNDVEAFAPMAVRNRNYLKLPYESVVDGLISRIADLLSISGTDADMTFQMASEALRAGELATGAAAGDGEYGDRSKLERLTAGFEGSVDEAVSDFQTEAARQIAFALYPGDVVRMCPTGDCAEQDAEGKQYDGVGCDRENCEDEFEIPDECTREVCTFRRGSTGEKALPGIHAAVEEAVEEFSDSTAVTAGAVDSGEIDDPIADAVFRTLSEPEYRPAYADEVAEKQWRAVIESATRSATRNAATEGTVTVSETDIVEPLDREIRQSLGNVSADIVEDRLSERLGNGTFDPEEYEEWVGGTDTPVRVPAGMPLLPLPGYWFATVNVWDIQLEAEYARFEVSTNVGTPDTASGMRYVRENNSVEREIAGKPRRLGSVEPISFSGRSALIVVVPPGGIGIGDRDDEDPECSPTWPVAGVVSEGSIQCRDWPDGNPEKPGQRK